MSSARRRATPDDRLHIVRLIEETHRDPQLVADVFGVSRSSVYEWLRKYREGGPEGLHSQAALGRPTAISRPQTERLYSLIRDHEPREFGFGTALWTRAVVGLLVRHEFGVQLSQPTVVKILTSLGLHIPRRSLPLGDDTLPPSRVMRELDLVVRAEAARMGATLLFAGSKRATCGAQFGGGDPDHVLSAVDGRGLARFAVSSTPPDAGQLIDFGTGLLHDCPGPNHVVVRLRPGCDVVGVRAFVDGTGGRLGLFVIRRKDDGADAVEFWGR
jgi:transposase